MEDLLMDDRSKTFIRDEIAGTVSTMNALLADRGMIDLVERVAALCVEAIQRGNKILFAGNGGSAADAQHLAAELVGRLAYDRPGLPAISFTTDTSILTAIGNDYGYDEVFRRQIDAIGIKGDVFIAISTSGRSKNLLKALAAAHDKGIATVGMTGATGGDMLALCDHCLRMPSMSTQKIQEGHIVIGHIFCGLIERLVFPRPA
jgi:D-sedoheptulose 7-phosphate isomerase